MKNFEAKGTYAKNGVVQKFAKEVHAENEKLAREKVLSLVGGKQRIRRKDITISEVTVAK